MVPEGWLHTRLKKVASKIGSGVTPKGGSSSYKAKGIPLIRSQNVLWGKLDFSDIAYIDNAQHEKMRGSKVQQGDVLLNITGASIGRVAVYSYVSEANVNQHVCIIRPVKDVDPIFVREYLLSHAGQKQIDQFQAGGNRQGLNFEQIGSFNVALPPLPEQKKIAQILSTWDQAITATERLLENSQQRKKGVMQQLLTGKKRLKGFGGGFKRRKLEDLAEVDARNLDSKTPAEFKFRYISLSDVDFGRINTRLSEHIYKTSPSRARRMVKEGDLLFATVRPNLQGFAKVLDEHDGAVASTGFAVLSPRSHVCGDYLYHYLFSAHVTGQVNSLVAGSNYPAISSGDVKKMLVYCPDLEEQTEIAEILNACDLDVSLLSQRLHILKEQKRALMQKLLTGKRRVNVDTEAA